MRDTEEDNIKVILGKESEREKILKIAAVGSDDERIEQVIRKRNETKGENRKSPGFSLTRARAVKHPLPTHKLRLIKTFF